MTRLPLSFYRPTSPYQRPYIKWFIHCNRRCIHSIRILGDWVGFFAIFFTATVDDTDQLVNDLFRMHGRQLAASKICRLINNFLTEIPFSQSDRALISPLWFCFVAVLFPDTVFCACVCNGELFVCNAWHISIAHCTDTVDTIHKKKVTSLAQNYLSTLNAALAS